MLTDRQRRRCGEIAAALDRGDLSLWLKAEPSLGTAERGEIWSQRAHVKAQAERRRQSEAAVPTSQNFATKRAARVETDLRLDDLDFWADDIEPEEPDDDDDDGVDSTVLCPVCNGRGRDSAGNECEVCNGSGRVPATDDDEGDAEARSYSHIEDEE
jgi:hypothetical protein